MLNAILAALGGGASSLGNSMMQDEERTRMEQQRMRELQAKAAADLAERQAQAEAASALKAEQRRSGVGSIKALFPDFQAPTDDFDPQIALRGLLDREGNKLKVDAEAGRDQRLTQTLAAQGERTNRTIEATGERQRRALEARIPPRDTSDDKRQAFIASTVTNLLKPDDLGASRMSQADAVAQAKQLADMVFGGGGGAPRATSAPPAPAGANLLKGLGGQASALPPLSARDRQQAASNPAFAAYLRQKGYPL